MYYFAYGSNMLKRRLWRRVPEAEHIMAPCLLAGYQLFFHKIGRDESGKCNAFHTGDDNHIVEGVLFDIPYAAVTMLDRYEGSGYDRESITVLDKKGESIEAFTYFANRIDDSLAPFDWYKQHVIAGAMEAGLSQAYVLMINAFPCVKDSNRERAMKEFQIHDLS